MNITKKNNTMKTRWITPPLQKELKRKKGDRKVAVSSTLLVMGKKELLALALDC